MSDYEYGKCSSCEYEKKPKDELPCRVCTYSCCKWTRKSTDKLERTIGYLNDIGWMQEHDKALTENAIPVVRCKDCRYWDEHSQYGYDDERGTYGNYCMVWTPDDDFYAVETPEDGFCYKGERKDDES